MNGLDRIVQEWIDKLLTRMGCSDDLASSTDRWIILLLIVLLALLTDLIICA